MLKNQINASVHDAVAQAVADDGYRRYSGSHCERLSVELAQRFLASDVLLCSSGTAALEVALRAAGVGPGDEVLLSAYDYPGNFWAIERVGAKPLLVDVEPDGWCISAERLTQAWEDSPAPALKAMVVSHLHGQLQDMLALRVWCEQHALILIEDACQAVGASQDGKPVGSLSHASILSFGGGKVLSSGRGGALLTADATFAQRARVCAGAGSGPYALSELQAVVVAAQLPWLNAINEQCRLYFTQLADSLQRLPGVSCPYVDHLPNTSFYQGGLLSDFQFAMIETLTAAGFPAGVGFPGFHRRSDRRCRRWQPLQNTASVAARTVTIHYAAALEPNLSASQAAALIEQLHRDLFGSEPSDRK
ncbi:MAG: aminotransferase class V-fold PLP-dependent enzyme [Pirellulaceae bacterium]|jgi:perosamine synthetase|nr:aminotransferase class V-fold PLP-dependent enzyme [Pirellulaceae bacterium]